MYTIRLHWRLVASSAYGGIYTGGSRYLFLLSDQLTGAGVLLDDQAGTRTSIIPPGQDCNGVVGIGGSRLVFRCFGGADSQTLELYSLTTHQWSSFDYSDHSQQACAVYKPMNCLRPVAVGADWLELEVADPSEEHQCNPWWGFENLRTRQWRQTDQPPCYTSSEPLYHIGMAGLDERTMLDLDSADLLKPVCAPVQLPAPELDITPTDTVISPIQTYDHYELVGHPFATNRPQLWRCGKHHPSRVRWPEESTSRLLLWRIGTNQLQGQFLASGKRFVASLRNLLPPSQGGLVVRTNHIYASDNNGHVWATLIPRLPRAR